MAVVRRKDGRFAVTYPLDGKQKWESFGRGLEAEKLANKRNDELIRTGVIRGYKKQAQKLKSPRFETLALAYLDAKSLTLSRSSIDNLFYSLKGVILPRLGNFYANRITAETLRNYAKKRLKDPVNKRTGKNSNLVKPVKNPDGTIKTISASSVHRELTDIIAILNWSVKQEYVIENPVKNFEKPKRDDAVIIPPNEKEIKAIIKHSADHLIRALLISYFTGLRPGATELLQLTWTDIDLSKGSETVHVISAKKGGIPERFIPAHPELVKHLKQWKKEDKQKGEAEGPIIKWKGKPVKAIKKSYYSAKKRAGITRRIRLYDFRHAFASLMLESGGDLKTTSELLGHTRTDTTTRIYQHTNLKMHRKNISLIPGLKIKGKKRKQKGNG